MTLPNTKKERLSYGTGGINYQMEMPCEKLQKL